jgi:hypothetical protein
MASPDQLVRMIEFHRGPHPSYVLRKYIYFIVIIEYSSVRTTVRLP